MATVTIQSGVLKQDKFLVADYSNAVSPFFQNGGMLAGELRDGVDYEQGDTLNFDIPAATKVLFAEFQTANGTKIAHTRSATTNPYGQRLTISCGSNATIYLFIIYQV